jgi:hypothetical protein
MEEDFVPGSSSGSDSEEHAGEKILLVLLLRALSLSCSFDDHCPIAIK